MRKILPILFFLMTFFGIGALAQTATTTSPSGSSASSTSPTPTTVVLKIIKIAANELKISSDWLWQEYLSGNCCIHLLDPKYGIYRFEVTLAAGGTAVLVMESIF